MVTPWMFVTGIVIIGYLAPEILVAAFRVRVPFLFNVLSATAFGLIAASFIQLEF